VIIRAVDVLQRTAGPGANPSGADGSLKVGPAEEKTADHPRCAAAWPKPPRRRALPASHPPTTPPPPTQAMEGDGLWKAAAGVLTPPAPSHTPWKSRPLPPPSGFPHLPQPLPPTRSNPLRKEKRQRHPSPPMCNNQPWPRGGSMIMRTPGPMILGSDTGGIIAAVVIASLL